MSALVVCYEHQNELNDINSALDTSTDWNLHYFDARNNNLNLIEERIIENEADFLICSKIFSKDIAQRLHQLYQRNPLLTIIYFYSALKEKEFAELHRAGIKYCFVGEARKSNLKTALEKLYQHRWKKIPQKLYNQNFEDLAPRAKKTLRFIEKMPLKYFNTETISDYLNISQSHFRKEFKKYFGLPFRDFKQLLLNHYEEILLFERGLKPKHIFSLLDYKNLSAFSRSFKSRHGKSWQSLMRTFN